MKKPTAPQPLSIDQLIVLPAGFPTDLVVASRTIYMSNPAGDTQYLVYRKGFGPENDPQFKEVVSATFDLDSACRMAMMRLHREALPPSHFQPRLVDCSFVQRFDAQGVWQVCLDARGRELGRADTREKAASMALHRALVGADDITEAEFGATTCVAQVEWTVHGPEFADQDGQERLARMVKVSYEASAEVRHEAKAEARIQGLLSKSDQEQREKEILALQEVVAKRLLAQVDAQRADPCVVGLLDTGDWHGVIVLHSKSMTSTQAQAFAYAQRRSSQSTDHRTSIPSRPFH